MFQNSRLTNDFAISSDATQLVRKIKLSFPPWRKPYTKRGETLQIGYCWGLARRKKAAYLLLWLTLKINKDGSRYDLEPVSGESGFSGPSHVDPGIIIDQCLFSPQRVCLFLARDMHEIKFSCQPQKANIAEMEASQPHGSHPGKCGSHPAIELAKSING